ncbi:MAG: OmpA family protein [Chlorobi bacterium]|nr:OmpA family protein [Chlorobiota bacterium]MBX7216609.1 OmpA family protein [Candidatus Kapabacteria bacterium]
MLRKFFLLLAAIAATASVHGQTVTSLNMNTTRDDFASTFAGNSRVMYLTSRSNGNQRVFTAERNSSGWGAITEIPELSEGDENGTVTLTPDGQLMIFSSLDNPVDGQGRTDLYSAQKINGVWTNIQNLGPEINSEYWDSHPYLSSDGRTLYFASDRPGGSGKVDIYISRYVNGKWGVATNAGTTINTADDDLSPSVAPDNKTFYFASNRPGGQGGFDLYTAKASNSGFSGLKNMGSPINSAADEYFYTALSTADRAFFSSNRSGGAGGLDIYLVSPNPFPSEAVVNVHGVVSDATTKAPLGSTITITDLKTNQQVARLRSDDINGEYFATLVAGREYSITAERNGYLFYTERYEVPTSGLSQDIEKDITLSPIAGGMVRLMVLFDYDKSDLLPESVSELERLAEFMQSNPDMRISLEGHTDDQGTDDYNDALSQRRAAAVRQYLLDAGIEGARMETKGFGKRKPLVSGTSDQARRTNRRVEMRVIQ